MTEANGDDAVASVAAAAKTYPAEVRDLLERGMAGDESALPAIRQVFDAYPDLARLLGDLARNAQLSLVGLIAGRDLTASEAIVRELAAMRTRLLAEAGSEIERLLVERLLTCWTAVSEAELAVAQQRRSGAPAALLDAATRRLDRAHGRYLTSAKALAAVKRLVRPAVSVLDLLRRPVQQGRSPRAAESRAVQAPAAGTPVDN